MGKAQRNHPENPGPGKEQGYGDGGRLTHYLGNDEYHGYKETVLFSKEEKEIDGSEAQGNELTDEDVEDEAEERASRDSSTRSDTLYDERI